MTLPDLSLDADACRFDWEALDRRFAWVRAMKDCPQDPVYHAEGNVWIHTRMVLDALMKLDAFAALSAAERWVVYAGALFHDVAKPDTTREIDGRLSARGHSTRGARRTRRILWELGCDPMVREHVCRIVAAHQVPFFAALEEGAARRVHRLSHKLRCDFLALVTEADGRGRHCRDQDDLIARVDLFRELCREEACLDQPRAFPDAHSRFLYFQTEGRNPAYAAHDDTRGEVTVLSGLPASGKDHWCRQHASDPVISLDDLRQELRIDPADRKRQTEVVIEARSRATELLRAGRPFVWNATNLTRERRTRIVDLATRYRMRVRIVHLETSAETQRARNRARPRPVPEAIVDAMIDRWEVPTPDEAHAVEYLTT